MEQKNNKGQIITFVIYGLAFLLIVVLPISLAIKIGGQAKGLFIFMAIMAAVITGVLSSILPKKRKDQLIRCTVPVTALVIDEQKEEQTRRVRTDQPYTTGWTDEHFTITHSVYQFQMPNGQIVTSLAKGHPYHPKGSYVELMVNPNDPQDYFDKESVQSTVGREQRTAKIMKIVTVCCIVLAVIAIVFGR